jgi:Ran GTPase-activating protein (RanGAP) involved in mRNA processing and transport
MSLNHNFAILIQRIRENDPTLNEIDLRGDGSQSLCLASGGDEYAEFIRALRLNHTITHVNLIHRYLMNLKEEEQLEFLEVIGSLPNLQHLHFGTSGLNGLPLRLLNAGLSKTQGRLKSLSIQSIHFRDNVYYEAERSSNTEDKDYMEFLRLLGQVLKESIESFSIQNVEDTVDLDALVHVLLALPNLLELVIQGHSPFNQRLTQQSLIRLFASETIRSLSLRNLRLGAILPEPLMILENNNTLESLSLGQNGLDFQCGMAIAYLLSVNRSWKELNLSCNTIPDDCGSAIVAALTGNTSLTSLDLTANLVELETSRRIAHLLASSQSALQVLTLNQNRLLDEGVAMIAAGLERNTSLKELSLAETKITEASCSVIVASLQTNTTLERLNLANNRLRDKACISLAVALESNSTLTSLNLHGNELQDSGVLRLAQMLKVNTTIERLNLANNPMLTTIAYEALERILIDHNYTLKHLWLPSTVDIVMSNCKIPSFTRLNRLDRKRLLDELDNAELWMEVMEKATQSDLDSLFFLTRANPATVAWMKV